MAIAICRSLTDILARYKTILEGACKTLTSLLLVAVVSGAIEKTVAGLDGVVDGLGWNVSDYGWSVLE